MRDVGIITYHSAYNYGSVLQAYATQEAISKLGYNPTIINYRLDEQRKVYSLYRKHNGLKTYLKDLSMLSIHKKRKERANRFEEFIQERMNLSEEFSNPEEFNVIASGFPVIVSGSDQIWNKHSLELERLAWRYIAPYVLHGYEGKKISYASSTANMTNKDLDYIKNDLITFSHISMREVESAKQMSLYLNENVDTVLDPTLLFDGDTWSKMFTIDENKERYVLFYSLAVGYSDIKRYIDALKKYANSNDLTIKIINPYINIHDKQVELCSSAGPLEFLSLIKNAQTVVTDSYHGTAFSINFGKNVYSLVNNGGAEFRKTSLMKAVGYESRILSDVEKINSSETQLDYMYSQEALLEMRNKSFSYLKYALEK